MTQGSIDLTPPPFFPYAKPSISSEDQKQVLAALSNDTITRGPLVESFEKEIANYVKAKYAVAFNSGSSALQACYFAANLQPGDKIISTPNTFVSTMGSAVQKGGRPIFIDIDPSTGNLRIDQLLETLNQPISRGKIFATLVHFAGIAMDMKTCFYQIKNPGAILIEDGAHALGSSYPSGEKVGSCTYSDMTIFSFHAVKTITTGEGGMVTTNNKEYFLKLKDFRDNGIERNIEQRELEPWQYKVHFLTGNSHLTEFQAALGLCQLKRLDTFIEKRALLLNTYRFELKDHPFIQLFTDLYDSHTAFHLAVVQIDFQKLGISRAALMKKLKEKGIGTQVHYIPLYRHPAFASFYKESESLFPHTEDYYAKALSLPLYVDLTPKDVKSICTHLKECLKTAIEE